jgi:nucleoside-diphosphate-sugar epimerase
VRLLVTGGSGVLGRALQPLALQDGHELHAPRRAELDLFDPAAVTAAVRNIDAVLHLATRIQALDQLDNPDAWRENDRLRADASRILVDASLATRVAVYVQPTVTFVYPADGPASEEHDQPVTALGASVHVIDAAHALLAATALESGIYNVCRDGERVSNERFRRAAGWHPRH